MSNETKIIALALIFSLVGGLAAGVITNTVLYFTAGGYVDAAYDQAFNLFNLSVIKCSSEYIEDAMLIEIDEQTYYCLAYEIDRELGKEYGIQTPRGDDNNSTPY